VDVGVSDSAIDYLRVDKGPNWSDCSRLVILAGSTSSATKSTSVYDLEADKMDEGYPLPVQGNWPGMPFSRIDAAVMLPHTRSNPGNQIHIAALSEAVLSNLFLVRRRRPPFECAPSFSRRRLKKYSAIFLTEYRLDVVSTR
jgi:hypothetical protein